MLRFRGVWKRNNVKTQNKTTAANAVVLFCVMRYNYSVITKKTTRKSTIFVVVLGLISGVLFFNLDLFHVKQAQAAAPSFVLFSSVADSTGADVTVSLPTHAANDIFLLEVVVRDTDDTITWPSGWTQIATVDRGTASRYWWAWKRAASASETDPLIDKSTATGDTYAAVIVYRGAIQSGDPWEVKGTPQTTTADPSVFTGITTLTDDSLVVVAVAGEDNNNNSITTTGVDPSGYADHYAESRTGGDGVITFSEAVKTTSGATGDVSVNWSHSISAGAGGVLLALKPANSPPTLSIAQPDGTGDTVTVGSAFNVTYTLSDPDNVVTAAFYYDANNSGLDGAAITGACATAAEGTNATCSWDTTGMTPGSYYVYGITNDGVNGQVSAYSGGMITINAVPVISVSGIVPSAGSTAGGTDITISGSNFQSGATIMFNGSPATDIVFIDSNTLTAKTPAHGAGMVDVTVTNPDLMTDTLVSGFMYTSAAIVTLNASPSTLITGESFVMSWSSENANTCVAGGAWSGAKATSGNETIAPASEGTHNYSLECTGVGGSGSDSVSVIVSVAGGTLKEPGFLFRFDGFAYPGGKLFLYDNAVPFSQLISDVSGRFATSFRLMSLTDKHLLSIIAHDREGNVSPSKTFLSEAYGRAGLIDILVAPTITLNKRAFGNQENVLVSGYATPGNKVRVEIDDKTIATVPTIASGYYTASVPLAEYSRGDHRVRTTQVATMSGQMSDHSLLKIFQIADPFVMNADLNSDGKLTISDWSIFLSSWASRDKAVRKRIDFNNDGAITIFDLSVFLSSFKKK